MKIEFEACGNGVVYVYVNDEGCGAIRVSDDVEFVRVMDEALNSLEVNMTIGDVSGTVIGVSIDQLG